MPRFAANLSMMFTELPFLKRFAAACRAGFTAVECQFPYDQDASEIAACLNENGLTLALFNLAPGNWAAGDRGLAAVPGRQAEFRASVRTALHFAAVTGTARLHVMGGIADAADPQVLRTYRESLRYACGMAGPEGVDILIEPLNPRDMPGYVLTDFHRAAGLIADLNIPNLRLQFDIYHRQIIHGDVLTGLRDLLPLTGHVQIAAVPNRSEPGSGELDDIRILRELDRMGYDGFVGCEYRPAGDTVAGLGWCRAFA